MAGETRAGSFFHAPAFFELKDLLLRIGEDLERCAWNKGDDEVDGLTRSDRFFRRADIGDAAPTDELRAQCSRCGAGVFHADGDLEIIPEIPEALLRSKQDVLPRLSGERHLHGLAGRVDLGLSAGAGQELFRGVERHGQREHHATRRLGAHEIGIARGLGAGGAACSERLNAEGAGFLFVFPEEKQDRPDVGGIDRAGAFAR